MAKAGARDDILATIRRQATRDPTVDAAAIVAARLRQPRRNLIPARAASLPHPEQVVLFTRMAEAVQATVSRVETLDAVPGAVAAYLAGQNLPADIVMAPDASLDAYPWDAAPLLSIRRGRAMESDLVGVTGAFAGIAETGTLMLASGADKPPSLHLLPDTHIAVLRADQVVASYEDGWDWLRVALRGNAAMPLGQDWALPRSVTFVTGPSRTGDIEQRIQLGAHGPRRLHIVLVGA